MWLVSGRIDMHPKREHELVYCAVCAIPQTKLKVGEDYTGSAESIGCAQACPTSLEGEKEDQVSAAMSGFCSLGRLWQNNVPGSHQ